jgi:type VI secretion system protein ImpH
MGAASRRDPTSLKQELYEHPARFEFFQAVRLLRKLASGPVSVAGSDPGDEFVRFCTDISLAFPTADVSAIAPPGEGERAAVMTVAFMGAASPSSFGSLPTLYTQQLLEEEREKNRAPRAFLDLFNHRVLSLFFRAWEKYRLDAQHESDQKIYEKALFGLLGLGTPGMRQRMPLDDRALLSRAGLLARTPMPATCLASLLESYFGVPAEIDQFCSTSYVLEPEERHRLGWANSTLGRDTVIGERVRLSQFKFRVRLGPLSWQQYQEFFPGSPGFGALDGLVRLAVTAEFDFDTRLVLRSEDVPALRLERQPSQACRLGWSTWLPRPSDAGAADEAILRHPDVPLAPTPPMS